ncbi:MAG: hypothetical protein MI754_07560 [Chromatiales bacterium]|nr:hypothetical protein [Chromatiales bacterium]
MNLPWSRLIPLLLIVLLGACSERQNSGAVEVKWDRDACERCRMVLSDRQHSAQVRFQPIGSKYTKVLMFDDIGCAVLWLEDKPWRDNPETEIWVTEHRNGEWIDARQANYVQGQITPMEYGLGAQLEATSDSLDFAAAKQHIFDIEERFNTHSTHLVDKLREQAAKRREVKQPNN